ncbi:methyltransferase domain-containing protein [Streptomyces chartreusis]|uniref:methyltransferase domain-containing protein n=1 Tax=Streptomyces chartreusis TaxID=1969 RepID=UPI0036A544B7
MSSANDVTVSGDPQGAGTDYLLRVIDEIEKIPQIKKYRKKSYDFLEPLTGKSFLDAGCGSGSALCELASLGGNTSQMHGLDIRRGLLEEAARRAETARVKIRLTQGSVADLPFDSENFDGIRCERTVSHLQSPIAVIKEFVRVLKPAGKLVVIDVDADTAFISPGNLNVTRRMVSSLADNGMSLTVGRDLPGLFKMCGLVDISAESFVIPHSYELFKSLYEKTVLEAISREGSASEVGVWWEALKEADDAGLFFMGVTATLVSGTKGLPS